LGKVSKNQIGPGIYRFWDGKTEEILFKSVEVDGLFFNFRLKKEKMTLLITSGSSLKNVFAQFLGCIVQEQ